VAHPRYRETIPFAAASPSPPSGSHRCAAGHKAVFDTTVIPGVAYTRPTLGETVGMAAEVAHGSCTDIPPVKKK
jgi:hypothetical protein